VKEIVVTFTLEPGFFGAAAAANWNERTVAVEAYLTNAFGDSPTQLQCYIAGTIIRRLLGGQMDPEVEKARYPKRRGARLFDAAAAVWYLSPRHRKSPPAHRFGSPSNAMERPGAD
jgi:hypothetical protein